MNFAIFTRPVDEFKQLVAGDDDAEDQDLEIVEKLVRQIPRG